MTQEEFHKRYHYNPNTDCLGEGGFGKVYKAYDTHRDRWVAIKMAEVRPHMEDVRLKKEVEMISKLPTHPNIAYYEECHTFSTFAGEYDFGILQYYEQGNLQQLLAEKQLNYEQKDSLLRQILEGVTFLHSQGIIHRDIKPQNILIVNRNGEYVPKITDFGISKKLDVNKSSVFTNSLAGAGTLSFASPEQLCGLTIKKNTDLWSFGVITYWLFTGKLPFNSGKQPITSEAGRIELFKQITKGEIPKLISQLNSPWDKLVKQCLVADNEKRITNVSQCSLLLGDKTVIQTVPTIITKSQTPKLEDTLTRIETVKPEGYSFPFKNLLYSIIVISFVLVIAIYWNNSDSKSVNLASKSESNKKISDIEKVTDIDGNIYNTVVIGTQTWMVENLKTTRYNDGTIIPNITDSAEWRKCNSGAYCFYNNNEEYCNRYGRLYNLHAVKTGKLAPVGWHIPTFLEWKNLENYLSDNGYKCTIDEEKSYFGEVPMIAKSLSSTFGWSISDKKGAVGNVDYPEYRNKTGFTALPGGRRSMAGKYFNLGEEGHWAMGDREVSYSLRYDFSKRNVLIMIKPSSSKFNSNNMGVSVRCIKDN